MEEAECGAKIPSVNNNGAVVIDRGHLLGAVQKISGAREESSEV